MIALDTSAVVAIALEESEKNAFTDEIAAAGAIIGAPTLVECRLVLSTKMSDHADLFMKQFVERPSVHPVAFTLEMYEVAITAFARFGKGRRHPAGLNFGDCMAYAVAKHHDAPLLYKGNGFSQTDIRRAVPR
jgi:ribonuclease VapC